MNIPKKRPRNILRILTVNLAAVFLALFAVTGCEQREKVIDVETPLGDVEVDRAVDGGDVDVDVDVDE